MTFKKIIGKIHLWLGLASGIVVFIVAITGAILVFEHEIMSMLGVSFVHKNPQKAIEITGGPMLKPSVLTQKLADKYAGAKIWGISYQYGYSSTVWGISEKNGKDIDISLHPYTGVEALLNTNAPLPDESSTEKFFDFILEGHLHLWLPHNAGKLVVGIATLIFLVMLITGIILWWPKNKAARKQRLRFQWKPTTKWKRKNYDLHNVLGFYMSWIALFITITGLVMAFEWFSRGWYFLLSAGSEPMHTIEKPVHYIAANPSEAADILWGKTFLNEPGFDGWLEIYYPEAEEGMMYRKMYPSGKSEEQILNPYTLKKLASVNTLADTITANNYSIHVGEIGGLPTKCLAFFASLIAASLPITGFYIWWGRRNKGKRH